ncbi:endonuclease/exonuclease/phosphatase family protein [Paenibacillus sp. GCM10028914]|uniref:endonuclease/exonuclease/phosphatase family protein n=1 Tax=Paenibacillus sp. GCM10028914 TaxID=3273416 RepID=UPI00360E0833
MSKQMMHTTVMSYNIQHGAGMDGQLSLQRIAKVIFDSGAEIACLQEVDRFFGERSDFKDQAKELARMLGYHYAYGPNLELIPVEGQADISQYGNAIISKHPILRSKNTLLSSFGDEQRGVLHVVIDLEDIQLNVYNTHLGLDAASRMTQIEELLDLISRSKAPSILMGDFNTEPTSAEIQFLLDSGLLINSFHNIQNINTWPANAPTEIIDYIFTSPVVQHDNQRVIHTQASDHLPIVVDVMVKS